MEEGDYDIDLTTEEKEEIDWDNLTHEQEDYTPEERKKYHAHSEQHSRIFFQGKAAEISC